MVTQNHFVIPATVLEKFRSRGFPVGVTLTADHCMWFKEEQSQFSMGQIAQILTCFIMEKPHTGLDGCPIILLSCFRARKSDSPLLLFGFVIIEEQKNRFVSKA